MSSNIYDRPEMGVLWLRRIGLLVRQEIIELNKLHGFATEYLGGGCAVAAWTATNVLWRLLPGDESSVHFTLGFYEEPRFGDHCWTEIDGVFGEEKAILDVTATQFGVRLLVVCVPPSNPLARNYNAVKWDETALLDVRPNPYWKEQSPLRYKRQIANIVDKIVAQVDVRA